MDEEIDVALLEKAYFEAMVEDQVPWAVVFAYYPAEGIIFETIEIRHKQWWRQQKRALTINSQVNLTQAYSLWRDGEEYKARKRVFFVCQMTIFATQLVATNTIFDWWNEANSLRPILFNAELKTWEAFLKVWRPIYDFLVERFIELRNAYRLYESELLTAAVRQTAPRLDLVASQIITLYESTLDLNLCIEQESWKKGATKSFLAKPAITHDLSSYSHVSHDSHCSHCSHDSYCSHNSHGSDLPLLSSPSSSPSFPTSSSSPFASYASFSLPITTLYIRARGLASLERDLAIVTKRHPLFPHLIHLSRTPLLTPVDSVVASECHGLLLDESNGYLPLAFSHHLEYQVFDDGPVHLLPNTPITITRNLDAPLVEMFWYEGQWRLATIETPDSSQSSQSAQLSSSRSSIPDIASIFWKVWSQYEIQIDRLDKTCCYSFWLLHPEARYSVLYERHALVFEGCIRWTEKDGLVDVTLNDSAMEALKMVPNLLEEKTRFGATTDTVLDNLASKEFNGDATTNVWGAQPLGNPLDLEIGGFKISINASRFVRILVPCAFLLRIQEIKKLEGDLLMQELEVLRLLVEQGDEKKPCSPSFDPSSCRPASSSSSSCDSSSASLSASLSASSSISSSASSSTTSPTSFASSSNSSPYTSVIRSSLELAQYLKDEERKMAFKSAWDFPLPQAMATFHLISLPLKSLIDMLDALLIGIEKMSQEEVRQEAAKKREEGHFIFLLKSTSPTPLSASSFLKYANPRRMRKYLANWWTKEHSKAPPRTTTQPSYKGGHTIK